MDKERIKNMIDYTKKEEEDDSKLTPRQTAIGTGIVVLITVLMIFGFYSFYYCICNLFY